MEVNLSPALKHPVVFQLFTSDESWFTLSEKYECEWCWWWWPWRWLKYPSSYLTFIQPCTVRTHGLSIPKVLECEMSREYVSIITWTVLESSPTVLGVSFRNRTGRTSEWIGWSHIHRVPGGSDGKESACNAGDLGSVPTWRREWPPTPLFLPGEFHGQRSLEGYSLWGHKESDTTEWLTLSLSKNIYIPYQRRPWGGPQRATLSPMPFFLVFSLL